MEVLLKSQNLPFVIENRSRKSVSVTLLVPSKAPRQALNQRCHPLNQSLNEMKMRACLLSASPPVYLCTFFESLCTLHIMKPAVLNQNIGTPHPHPMCLPSQVDKLRCWKKFVSLANQLDSATHGHLDHNPK